MSGGMSREVREALGLVRARPKSKWGDLSGRGRTCSS